jgi:hypothetical protein
VKYCLAGAAQGTVVSAGTCPLASCDANACQCTISGTANVCYDPPNYGVGTTCTYYPQPTNAGCVTTAQV